MFGRRAPNQVMKVTRQRAVNPLGYRSTQKPPSRTGVCNPECWWEGGKQCCEYNCTMPNPNVCICQVGCKVVAGGTSPYRRTGYVAATPRYAPGYRY